MVTASGWAPPIPPRPAVSTSRPANVPPKCCAASSAKRLVGSLQDPLGPDVDPGARRHLAVHRQAGRLELARMSPSRPTSGTSIALEIRTRGRIGWVRKTPTGLPDWIRSVSSSSSARRVRDDRVEALPLPGGLAGAAVDDQLLGPLGHLRVEVVHQHPQGGLLRPALAGDRGAASGPNFGDRGRGHAIKHGRRTRAPQRHPRGRQPDDRNGAPMGSVGSPRASRTHR